MSRARVYALADSGLLVLLCGAVLSATLEISPIRPFLAVAAAILVPGGAAMTRLRTGDLLTEGAFAIGFSFAIVTIGSLLLAWTGYWHPETLAAVLASIALFLLVWDLAGLHGAFRSPDIPRYWEPKSANLGKRPTRRAFTVLALLPVALALVLWAMALDHIPLADLGNSGLPPVLPGKWYIALAIVVMGASYLSWSRWSSGLAVAIYIAAIVTIIYATIPAITTVPEHAYVYKHIGVTRFIATNGGVDQSVDIYNRWPGFFASAASLARWAGVGPMALAKWASPFFASINAILVAALARSVSRDVRVTGAAVLVFTLGNWIGQNYFAPQAAAFVIDLTVLTVFLRSFATEPFRPLVARVLKRVRRQPCLDEPLALSLPWSPTIALVVLVVLDAVIVATHQLTPYALLTQLAALFVLGLTNRRGKVLIVAAVLVTIGYVIPQVGYLSHNFGLLQSFDPFRNATNGEDQIQGLNMFQGNAGMWLSELLGVLMVISAWRLMRRGAGKRAVALGVISLAPLTIIFVQGYGNNVQIRLLLFAIPFWSLLIAMGLKTIRRLWMRRIAAVLLSLFLAVLCVQALFGALAINLVPPAEVSASRYFYKHAPAGSVLLAAAPEFPGRIDPRYAVMVGPVVDDQQEGTLIGSKRFRELKLPHANVSAVIGKLKPFGERGFVVFATSGYTYAHLTKLSHGDELRDLEEAIARSSKFRLWYRNGDTRIYKWLGRKPDRARQRQSE
jgi:hypothetical protein